MRALRERPRLVTVTALLALAALVGAAAVGALLDSPESRPTQQTTQQPAAAERQASANGRQLRRLQNKLGRAERRVGVLTRQARSGRRRARALSGRLTRTRRALSTSRSGGP